MTPDQIEAERTKFEAWVTATVGVRTFSRYDIGNYVTDWINDRWRGWLARAEEQYASERAAAELRIRQQGILQIRCEEGD